jgi:hypothetical protein
MATAYLTRTPATFYTDRMEPSFDPGGFYEFDLARGAVRTRDGSRVLVLSDDVLGPLVSMAVRNGDVTAVRVLGRQLGDQALHSLGKPPAGLSPETVLGHTASVLALTGWGRLRFEQWGDAVVAALDGLPELDDQHIGVGALLGGVISALAGRDVACVPVGESGRFLVVDPGVAEQVWAWSKNGAELPEIVARLAVPGGAG